MVILFSGYNQRAVISFIRTLTRRGVPFGIIALSNNDTIFRTEYKKNVMAVRKYTSLNLQDIMESISLVQKAVPAEHYIITPTSEALNRFLLDHRMMFEERGCVIPLVKKELYNAISDKYSFSRLCTENGIDIPKEYLYPHVDRFPCVAKPRHYFSMERNGSVPRTTILNDAANFDEFLRSNQPDDFYFQEYINGRNFYLLYYFTKDHKVFKSSQENLVQQPHGRSIIAAVSSDFHANHLSMNYETMLLKIGFRGLIMIDVFQTDERILMIEANPRLWGPSQLVIDGPMNLFDMFLYDNHLIDSLPVMDDKGETKRYYFNYDALLDVRMNNETVKYHGRYTSEQFCQNFPSLLASAVYNRSDTIELYNDAHQAMGSLIKKAL